ncbi:centrosomal protein of 72 kDa, partial [Megalops cyprinoides]|uniref:centrosomal protein of 72 kDa n=1 Tax=Megalops cyprinoides TaxID=118141 RepID=UPI0018643D42
FENMAAEHLCITEQWIREKLRLQHNCLVDVKSLCLPGSYEGKIRHLGNSLKNFVRLKILDLSHNALVSVEGLQHLKMLEQLNLYYNRIPSLREVLVLRKLKALKELDLRLNPVVKNSPEYRLHLVYALSNLRKLDDCPVRDSERKASLLHFSSDAVAESRRMPHSLSDSGDQRSSQPRMKSVNRLARSRSVLDYSDEAVLNLVAKSNWDLSKPPALTGSANKEPASQLYPLQGNLGEDVCSSESSPSPRQDSYKSILRIPEEIRDKQRPLPNMGPSRGVALSRGDSSVRATDGLRVTFIDSSQTRCRPGSERGEPERFQGQYKMPAKVNFTPNPVTNHPPSTQDATRPRLPQNSPQVKHPIEGLVPNRENSIKEHLESVAKESCRKPLELLLGLVDKHWDGKKSLQRDHKFLTQAAQILSTLEREALNGDETTKHLREQVEALNSERERREREHQAQTEILSAQLKQADSSIEDLDRQLKNTLEENVSLQKQLIEVEQRLLTCGINGVPDTGLIEKEAANEELKRELELMKGEVEQLRVRVQQGAKVQELADMLQESHRSLVSTNERLLAELAESRARHRAEVEKLHFSFNELSRTISLVPEMSKRLRPEDM